MVLKSVVCEEYTEGAVDQSGHRKWRPEPTKYDRHLIWPAWLSDMIDLKTYPKKIKIKINIKTYPNLREVMWKKKVHWRIKKKKITATAACWVSARMKGGKHGTSSAEAILGQLSTVPWLSCLGHRPSTAAQVYGDNRCCCQTWSQSHKGL